jgi:AcrR family transcriptional regulator
VTRTGPDTRRRLLDAAIPLVARGGLKALSHRAVEDAAGVARGSARYHLGSRHEIVEGLMERMGALELETLREQQHRLALDYLATGVIDIETATRSTFAMVFADRDQVLARYWLTLEAARDDSLQPIVRRWREAFTSAAVPLLDRLGASDPAGTAADLVDLVDGIVFARMCTGREEGMLDRVVASAVRLIRERIGQTSA